MRRITWTGVRLEHSQICYLSCNPPHSIFGDTVWKPNNATWRVFLPDVPHGFPHYLQEIRGPATACVNNMCSHMKICRTAAADTVPYSVQTPKHRNYDFTYAV